MKQTDQYTVQWKRVLFTTTITDSNVCGAITLEMYFLCLRKYVHCSVINDNEELQPPASATPQPISVIKQRWHWNLSFLCERGEAAPEALNNGTSSLSGQTETSFVWDVREKWWQRQQRESKKRRRRWSNDKLAEWAAKWPKWVM